MQLAWKPIKYGKKVSDPDDVGGHAGVGRGPQTLPFRGGGERGWIMVVSQVMVGAKCYNNLTNDLNGVCCNPLIRRSSAVIKIPFLATARAIYKLSYIVRRQL